jgi:hypothetical protein
MKTDTSLTSVADSKEIETIAQQINPPEPILPARPPLRRPMELVALPIIARVEEAEVAVNEPPRYTSRNWRAAAWERERERERELRAVEHHPGMSARRRYGA